MKTSFVKMWAITMTGMALLLLGVLIGKYIFNQPAELKTYSVSQNQADINQKKPISAVSDVRRSDVNSNPTTQSQSQSPENSQVQFITPDELKNIKTEWHTDFINNQYDGYVALFDPQRRELIIEKCQHPGYFDEQSQQPVAEGIPFCETFVYSQILTLTAENATVKTKKGEVIKMSLALKNDNQLDMSLLDTEISFIPGSKNDLYQLMERSEPIKQQKQAYFNWQEAEFLKERAELESKNSEDSP